MKSRKDVPYGFDFAVKTANFGRSDRTQTCGLMVPNHPRYQLRHAPIYLIIPQKNNFCKWSNLWSNHFVARFLKSETPEKVSVYKGFRASWK